MVSPVGRNPGQEAAEPGQPCGDPVTDGSGKNELSKGPIRKPPLELRRSKPSGQRERGRRACSFFSEHSGVPLASEVRLSR